MRPHVTLRPLMLRDTEDAARWGEDPDFCAYAGWTVDRPTADRARLWRDLVTDPRDDLLRLAAVDDAGSLVGYVDLAGLEPDRRELGYLVGSREHWGRGWGTSIAGAGLDHGFSVLGLREIWAEALDANAPSVRILERLGLTETGRGDEGAFLGEPTYFRRFATTREAWRARSSARERRSATYSPGVDVDWNAEVVDQLEWHWRDRLRPRLSGLTDDEYFWEPVPDCWTVRRRGTGSASASSGAGEFTMDFDQTRREWEPVTTIAWRLAHVIVGFAETSGTHFGGPPADMSTFAFAGTADEALQQLDETHERWVEGVRSLGGAGLARPQGPTQPPEFADAPMARLVLYMHVEVVHHGAEICLLRDLYGQRFSS